MTAPAWRIDTVDGIEGMRLLGDKSAAAIIGDLPYGTTQNVWDSVIPLSPFWSECWRILPQNGPVVLTAAQPFTSLLVASQVKRFRYDWVWEKTSATGHLNAKRAPLRAHESVLVFCRRGAPYYPQKTSGHKPVHVFRKNCRSSNYGAQRPNVSGGGATDRYPRSVQVFASDKQKLALHPTQKPVALMKYLIATYTQPGDLIVDPTCGSGTTGVAALLLGRRFIGFENDPAMADIARERLTGIEMNMVTQSSVVA